MTVSTKTLNEILDYFQNAETDPGGDWAFPDDYSSLGLDFRAPDGTVFWIELERNDTIRLVWRPAGAEMQSLIFALSTLSPAERS
jgi:hypothetical protein